MSPFEIPQNASITQFVQESQNARKEMDQMAKANQEIGKSTKTTTKSTKDVGSFIKGLKGAAPQLALVAAVAPSIMDFMSGLTEPFDQVGEAVEELGYTASVGFEEMATDMADSIYELQPVAEQLGTWIGATYDKIEAKDWEGLSENVESGLTNTWDGIVDFFADDQRMADIGAGGAAIVNGIAGFLSSVTQDDWDTIFDGIHEGLKSFVQNVDWEAAFMGILTAFNELIAAIVASTSEGLEKILEAAGVDTDSDSFQFALAAMFPWLR